MQALKNTRGFTLIELLIVIVIIGILATTIVPKIMGAPAKARDAGRLSELRTLGSALQMYYFDNGQFPASSGECLKSDTGVGEELVSGGYLQRANFPSDPTTSSTTGDLCVGAGNQGLFYYRSLSNFGINDNSFILVADVESDNMANLAVGLLSGLTTAETVSDALSNYNGNAVGKDSVYVLLGES